MASIAMLLAAWACGGDEFSSSEGAGAAASSDAGGECPAGNTCVPAPPDGWQGPDAIYVGDSRPDGCPQPWTNALDGHVGEPDAPHACNSCSCGEPDGVTCSKPVVTVYDLSSCGGRVLSTFSPLSGGQCLPQMSSGGAKITAPSQPVGTDFCAPAGGEIDKAEPTWPGGDALLCVDAPPRGSCGDGVCAPTGASPFRDAACIHRDGDESCPDGYPQRVVFYRGIVDDRSCSACGCQVIKTADCLEPVVLYDGGTCVTVDNSVYQNGECSGVVLFASASWDETPTGAQCEASGGHPEGGVTPAHPVTVCCTE